VRLHNVKTATGDVMEIPMDSIVQWLMTFHNKYPVVGILFLMILLDVAIGLCAAIITKTVSSTVSQHGMIRKVINLLLIGVGAVLEPYAGGIPLSKMIAMAFIVTEAISITENAARAGVPVPKPLLDVLQKLRGSDKDEPKPPAQPVIQVNRASTITVNNQDDHSTTHLKKSDVPHVVAVKKQTDPTASDMWENPK